MMQQNIITRQHNTYVCSFVHMQFVYNIHIMGAGHSKQEYIISWICPSFIDYGVIKIEQHELQISLVRLHSFVNKTCTEAH